jgi:alpha-beta hydrolase superfamily lysophospholipase
MKKAFKILGWFILTAILLVVGLVVYVYQTNDMIKAIVNNDESKLYYFPSNEIKEMKLLSFSEKTLIVDDSIKINTYQFKQTAKKARANIFFIHGAGGNVTYFEAFFKPLTSNGFNVYAVDWRGYGKSTGVPNYKAVLNDTRAAFNDFVEETKSDSLKTIVYGMSLGGQLAVKITKDNQSIVDALVLDSSVESAQSLAIDYAPIEYFKEGARKTPERFNQLYVAVRDIKDIVNIPKLIIHGKNDKEVPFFRGQKLFNAAKEPKTFWANNSKHIMTLIDYPTETIQKINNLISQ